MKPQLNILQLEDRLTPALNVLAAGGSLLITGTPNAASPGMSVGHNQEVSVTRVYGFTYEVKDAGQPVGAGDHGVPGEYNISGDLKLKFDSIDNDVVVDLNGGTLRGNLSVDLGTGDRGSSTQNFATVVDGTVGGGVSFAGAIGLGEIAIGIPIERFDPRGYGPRYEQNLEGSSPVTVGQGVAVNARSSEFSLGEGSVVSGNLFTGGATFNWINGTVNGNVDARWPEARSNSNLYVNGQVGGNVTFDSVGQNYAYINGTVNGSVAVRGKGEYTGLRVNGQVGRDVSIDTTRNAEASISGKVLNDAFVRANKADVIVAATGTVGDDLRVFSTGTSADSKLTVAGKVGDDIQVESTGAAKATISGTVMKDAFLRGDTATLTVGGTVTRDAIVRGNTADLTVAATGVVGDDARVFSTGGSDDPSIYSANLTVTGRVGDDVQVESSGAAKAAIGGTVMGDASVQASNAYTVSRSVSAFLDVTGLVGQNVNVNVVGGGPVGTTIAGTVNGSVAVKSTNSTGVRLDVTASGQVGKDVTLDSTTDSGRVNVNLAGKVNRNVVLRTVANVTDVDVTGQVVGALNITDGDGDLTVKITDPVLKARAVILPGEGDYQLI